MAEREEIQRIPRFECSDGSPLKYADSFYKNKLMKALDNPEIICLVRGEGRSRILNDIVFHPEILFDWGEKSLHAFLTKTDERVRRFCDPGVVDKELLISYLRKYGERLKVYYRDYPYFRRTITDVDSFEEKLIDRINELRNEDELLCIKEWLLYAMHTMGVKEFSRISTCISCSYGENKFDIARKFGAGRTNNYFVVMDNWVYRQDEGKEYRKTDYVNEVLAKYGLSWFSNRNNEIMLKYGIFPQHLVGYYFYDRNTLVKYVLNKHYVEKWDEDPEFEVGNPIYFEQFIDFTKLGPYNTVYEYNGRTFSVVGRR